MLGADLKYAWRAMRRTPAPYLIASLTIALGVGANAAMFSVVNGVILAPLSYPDADRIVRVWPEKRWSVEMESAVVDGTTSFERFGTMMDGSLTLLGEGEPEVVQSRQVTAGWMEVLGGLPHLGRTFRPGDDFHEEGPVVVLSYDYWANRFGADPMVIGRTLDLSGYGVESRTVVGVMRADFTPVNGDPSLWVPLVKDPDVPGYRGSYGGTALAVLGPGVSHEQAIGDMRRLIPSMQDTYATQFREIRHSPVDVVGLKDSVIRETRAPVLVLFGAVTFVLLIACTNVANLLLARTTARRKEVGLRIALGAERGRIFRQMLTESGLLAVLGGAAGVAVAYLVMPVLRSQLSTHLPRADLIVLDVRVLIYALLVSLLAGIVFGVAPGLRAANSPPGSVLNEHARGSVAGRRTGRLNNALVVSEIALSLVLVVGAALMLKSLVRLGHVDTGMNIEGVASLDLLLPAGTYEDLGSRQALFSQLSDRVATVPGVEDVTFSNLVPMGGSWSGIPYAIEGQDSGAESLVAGYQVVTPAFFDVFEIPLVAGRLLLPTDVAEGEAVALVDRGFAERHWSAGSALGQVIVSAQNGSPIARVVGVVEGTRFAGVEEPPRPTMYFPADQNFWFVRHILVRTAGTDPLGVLAAVSDVIHEVGPNLALRNPATMEATVANAAGDRRFFARLMGAFAALALFLGVVGVYGVMSYAVGQRTREIGVRLALGATSGTVLVETLRRGMAPVAVGVAVGLAAAIAGGGVLDALLYEVDAADPLVLVGVSGLLLVTGLVAIVVPARRAMLLTPVTALRSE